MAQRVDAVIDDALAKQRIVGGVLLIAQSGTIVYERAAGFADREAQTHMRIDTLLRLSSITKPIVTAAALALIARGELALDDDIDKWLPDFHAHLADGTRATVTVRQLLTHTAGLDYGFQQPADGPYHRAKVSDGIDQPGLGFATNLRRIASAPLVQSPGSGWRYSVAIDVLGAVLERAHGKPLPHIVAELVTQPLAMHDTAFTVVERQRLATPYVDGTPPTRMTDPQIVRMPFGDGVGISFSPARALNDESFPSGGAGMTGAARDIVNFLECIRRGGEPILPRLLADSMLENQLGALPGHAPGWGFSFGGALLVEPKAAQTPQSAGTWMWGGVYGHSWFVDPVKEITVVFMTNTALEGMIGPTAFLVRNAVYG
jgi:CubicO group peptidase (beta-lactamase class C family)